MTQLNRDFASAWGEPRRFCRGHASEAILASLAELRSLARAHLDIFYAKLPGLPGKSRPAFLPVCLCELICG
jgi:phytoene/squalene synthetase